ncbi:MAG TPA: hypothetical protein VHV10_11745 [Ktedonobacteraceae bacterium]|nr:hypothetical protein [Ktedonobacteraceae bacterium]
MDTRAESDHSSRFRISLEVVPDDPQDADPALVDAVGRDTFDALRNDGYTIKQVYNRHKPKKRNLPPESFLSEQRFEDFVQMVDPLLPAQEAVPSAA